MAVNFREVRRSDLIPHAAIPDWGVRDNGSGGLEFYEVVPESTPDPLPALSRKEAHRQRRDERKAQGQQEKERRESYRLFAYSTDGKITSEKPLPFKMETLFDTEQLQGLAVTADTPFYVDINSKKIEAITGAIRQYCQVSGEEEAPILAVLNVIAGAQEIPPGSQYDELRKLKDFVTSQVENLFTVHCPGNSELDGRLQTALRQPGLETILPEIYFAQYDNVTSFGLLTFGAAASIVVGAGAAFGVESIARALPQGINSLPPSVRGFVGGGAMRTIIGATAIGSLYTVADVVDNSLAAIPDIFSMNRRGVPLSRAAGINVKNAASGAGVGEIGNWVFGLIAEQGGVLTNAGFGGISLVTSLGFAGNSRTLEDTYRRIYDQLLKEGRVLPPPDVIALQERMDTVRAEYQQLMASPDSPEYYTLMTSNVAERKALEEQIAGGLRKARDDYAHREASAVISQRRANISVLVSPAAGFIPVPVVREAVVGGSEGFANFFQALGRKGADWTGHGYRDRLHDRARKEATTGNLRPMDWSVSGVSDIAQSVVSTIGYVANPIISAQKLIWSIPSNAIPTLNNKLRHNLDRIQKGIPGASRENYYYSQEAFNLALQNATIVAATMGDTTFGYEFSKLYLNQLQAIKTGDLGALESLNQRTALQLNRFAARFINLDLEGVSLAKTYAFQIEAAYRNCLKEYSTDQLPEMMKALAQTMQTIKTECDGKPHLYEAVLYAFDAIDENIKRDVPKHVIQGVQEALKPYQTLRQQEASLHIPEEAAKIEASEARRITETFNGVQSLGITGEEMDRFSELLGIFDTSRTKERVINGKSGVVLNGREVQVEAPPSQAMSGESNIVYASHGSLTTAVTPLEHSAIKTQRQQRLTAAQTARI